MASSRFAESIIEKYVVKITKDTPCDMASLAGENMQVGENGEQFFEIPAHLAEYYETARPTWKISEPYLPDKNKNKRYVEKPTELEYPYHCDCGFNGKSQAAYKGHLPFCPNNANAKTQRKRNADKHKRINELILQDKLEAETDTEENDDKQINSGIDIEGELPV